MKRRDKNYVSDMDKFLTDFDKKFPQLTQSQRDEIAKYERIFRLRDNPASDDDAKEMWEGF